MTSQDRSEVERIVRETQTSDQGLRDLVKQVAQSKIFQQR